jgi:hypothetical protein
MARTAITPQTLLGAYPTLPIASGGADLEFTANTDPTDRSTTIVENKTIVLCYNTDVAPQTVTINSAPDTFNREGDISAYSLAAGKVAVFGPFKAAGWANAGVLEIDVSDPKLEIAVITLP